MHNNNTSTFLRWIIVVAVRVNITCVRVEIECKESLPLTTFALRSFKLSGLINSTWLDKIPIVISESYEQSYERAYEDPYQQNYESYIDIAIVNISRTAYQSIRKLDTVYTIYKKLR